MHSTRNQRNFWLRLNAFDLVFELTLTANELAFYAADLHSIATDSHYLPMKTAGSSRPWFWIELSDLLEEVEAGSVGTRSNQGSACSS